MGGQYRDVWRLEDDEGRGIYVTPKAGAAFAVHDFYCPRACPCPYSDEGLRDFWDDLERAGRESAWSFGFATLDQCRQWFDSPLARQLMTEDGIRLNHYRVPPHAIHDGTKQIIFIRSEAELVECRRPDFM